MFWFTAYTGEAARRELFVTIVVGKSARIYRLRIWNEVQKRLLDRAAQR
jgi:hypothetical protein